MKSYLGIILKDLYHTAIALYRQFLSGILLRNRVIIVLIGYVYVRVSFSCLNIEDLEALSR